MDYNKIKAVIRAKHYNPKEKEILLFFYLQNLPLNGSEHFER